jgi:hypothetical protein
MDRRKQQDVGPKKKHKCCTLWKCFGDILKMDGNHIGWELE